MKGHKDLNRLMFDLSSLVDLGQEVTSSKEFNERMKSALYVITGMFSVPKAALFAYHAESGSLELRAEKGLRITGDLIFPIDADAIKILARNEPCDLREIRNSPLYAQNAEVFTRLQTRTIVPLFVRSGFIGAISLGERLGRTSYRKSERDVLKVAAQQMAITLHNAHLFLELSRKARENEMLYENMRYIYHDTIQAFAAAIDAKDEYTKNHSYRVASYAVAIARRLGWKEKDLEGIYIAGLLHDIGKIILDNNLINKGKQLTEREREEIRRHPQISYDILSKIRFPWNDITDFVKHHHERLDGSGYPDSLTGSELSDGVKILALADAFDAMTTDRPYRERLPLLQAFNEVKKCVGTQFDAKISGVFFEMLREKMNGKTKESLVLLDLQSLGAFHLRRERVDSEAYAQV